MIIPGNRSDHLFCPGYQIRNRGKPGEKERAVAVPEKQNLPFTCGSQNGLFGQGLQPSGKGGRSFDSGI